MKKLFLFAITLVALTSCLTTGNAAEVQTFKSQEFMVTAHWQVITDPYGSSFKLKNEIIEEGEIIVGDVVSVKFVMIKQSAPNDYPDVELAVDSETSFEGATTLTLTYRTDQELMIRLNQTELMSAEEGGDDSYALYYSTLSRSNDWNTVTVKFSDFKQPNWAEPSSKSIILNLSNIRGVGLAPVINGDKGGEAFLEVKSCILE